MFIIAQMNSPRKFLLRCSFLFCFNRSSASRANICLHHSYFCTKILLINMLYYHINENFCFHSSDRKQENWKRIRFSVISQLRCQLDCSFPNLLFCPSCRRQHFLSPGIFPDLCNLPKMMEWLCNDNILLHYQP